MKKVLFAAVAAVIVCFGIISCGNEGSKFCFEVRYTIPNQPEQTDSLGNVTREAREAIHFVGYRWCTEAYTKTLEKEWKEAGYQEISITKMVAENDEDYRYRTENDCLANEVK